MNIDMLSNGMDSLKRGFSSYTAYDDLQHPWAQQPKNDLRIYQSRPSGLAEMCIVLWRTEGIDMTSKMLLEQYMAERHALGFSLKTDEGCIRRFLQDFAEPDDGEISFTKEYVLDHIGNRRNLQTNTILRDVSAINGFLDFVIREYEKISVNKILL